MNGHTRRILKHRFSERSLELEVDAGRVLLVAAQLPDDLMPTVWIEHEDLNGQMVHLTIYGTGSAVADGAEHVGTAICDGGHRVWHVYRNPAPTLDQVEAVA